MVYLDLPDSDTFKKELNERGLRKARICISTKTDSAKFGEENTTPIKSFKIILTSLESPELIIRAEIPIGWDLSYFKEVMDKLFEESTKKAKEISEEFGKDGIEVKDGVWNFE